MKKLLFRAALASALFTGTLQTAQAANPLVYKRALNPAIGITAGNSFAIGRAFTISDSRGTVVLKGVIGSANTFYIPTSKLGNGAYRFAIGGDVLQEFIVR